MRKNRGGPLLQSTTDGEVDVGLDVTPSLYMDMPRSLRYIRVFGPIGVCTLALWGAAPYECCLLSAKGKVLLCCAEWGALRGWGSTYCAGGGCRSFVHA